MNTREIQNIFVGDTQGQKLFLGDDLIWPVGPTPTGGTITAVYNARNTSTAVRLLATKENIVRAEYQGVEIPVTDGLSYTFPTTGLQTVVYTITGDTIGNGPFYYLPDLVEIVIPDSITTIGDSGFCIYGQSLTAVTIPDSVTYIGTLAFQYCTSLPSISIPSGVTSISNDTFAGCTSLSSVILPNGLVSIGNDAFENCTRLPSISIPRGVTTIGYSAFSGCTGLSTVSIPDGVTSISSNLFNGCTNLSSVSMPSGATFIGGNAFDGCASLSSISIPSGVTSIQAYAFRGCSGLTEMVFEGVTPPSLFGAQPLGATSYTFPIYVPCESVEAYKTAFTSYASRITCVEPETRLVVTYDVTSTTRNTNILYTGTTGFSKAELEDGTEIPVAKTYMFPETGQTKVYYTLTGTSTPEKAFYNLKNIVGIELPSSGLEEVGASSFTNCWNIVNITIPNSVQRIDDAAFATCCGATGTINIPSDCVVGANAFYRCRSLTGITVQSGATLGYRAFYMGSSVINITIKPDVTFVSGRTFETGYESLEEVIFEGTPPQNQPEEVIFNATESYRYPIYVPNDQVDAWKQWFDGITKSRVCPISERTIPAAYKRLAFLSNKISVGDGYVEADYSESGFNESMWAEYDFGLASLPTGSTQVHILSGDNYRFAQIDTAGNWSVRRGGESLTITSSPFVSGSTSTLVTRTYTFFKNGDNIEVDGVVVGSVTDPGTSVTADSIHPRFFSVNGSDDYNTYGAKGYLFRGKIGYKDEGSSLIAHYVPAQRRSDDVYGLWDFVTSTFLPVNNGTSGN